MRKIILLAGDAVLLYASLILTLAIRFWGAWQGEILVSHITAFSWLYVFWLVILYMANMYELATSPRTAAFFSRLAAALISFFVVGALFFYLVPSPVITPKTNLLIHIILFGALIYIWRIIAARLWSSLFSARIGVFDPQGSMRELRQSLGEHQQAGYSVIVLDRLDGLKEQIVEKELHAVIVDDSIEQNPALRQEFYACLGSGARLMDKVQAYETFVSRIPLSSVGPHWFIEQFHGGGRRAYLVFKRAFDIVAALFIILVSSPLWLIIALAIKVDDRGLVFYSQERIGKNRKLFRIFKFRTMRQNAEANGAVWAEKNDSRVTRVGRILRRLHLDELPQMLNVLKGNISLVGPRPERPDFVARLEAEIPHYHIRHLVEPGFTGWAQVRFRYARSVMDSKEKFEYDLFYVKNRSLLLDALIVLKSVHILLRGE